MCLLNASFCRLSFFSPWILQGIEPMHENWGLSLGEELDSEGDPPRIWKPGKPTMISLALQA